uniref:NinE family protein n=1 Tax=Steinernema glaseri TaxID=37863 RepID=A0A1I7ZJW5_9BILA
MGRPYNNNNCEYCQQRHELQPMNAKERVVERKQSSSEAMFTYTPYDLIGKEPMTEKRSTRHNSPARKQKI